MSGNIRSADEKFNIIMESLKTDISITELCRKYGISVSQFYKWKDQFFEEAKSGLADKNAHNEFENDKLKQIIGEQTMIIEAFKKTVQGRKR
ncbi:MAG: transposase [Candidatus Parvarchaeota archaeon]